MALRAKKKKALSSPKHLIKLAKARRRKTVVRRTDELKTAIVKALEEGRQDANQDHVAPLVNPEETEGMPTILVLQISVLTILAQVPLPATSFPEFMKLPAELRDKIWEMSLPGVRVFEPSPPVSIDPYHGRDWGRSSPVAECAVLKRFPVPNIRGACKEAWNMTEKHRAFRFGPGGGIGGSWFNKRRDIVYITTWTDHPQSLSTEMDKCIQTFIKPAEPRHIALDRHGLDKEWAVIYRMVSQATWPIETICATVERPVDYIRRTTPCQSFFRLMDDDLIYNNEVRASQRALERWADIRGNIQRRFVQDSINDGITLPLFRVEGMEISRRRGSGFA